MQKKCEIALAYYTSMLKESLTWSKVEGSGRTKKQFGASRKGKEKTRLGFRNMAN